MITKILKKKLSNFDFFIKYRSKAKIRSMMFSKNSIMNRKKKICYKKNNEIRSYIRYEKFYFMCRG